MCDDYFEPPRDHACLDAAIVPQLHAGDLLLWDSRTVHCSSAGHVPPSGRGLARLVTFVCFTPAERADEACLERRRQAVAEGTTTTHTPEKAESTAKMIQFYPELGTTLPIAATPYELPQLSESQWQLVDGR